MPNFESIIDKLFDTNKSFNRDDFLEFVGELTGKYPNNIKKSQDKEGLHILDIYEDNNNEKMAIIIYKMPNASKVEKARNEQRNLISSYLRNEGVYSSINNVLVAFYSDDNPDWRLSFIKQEFKLSDTEYYLDGRKKLVTDLTPAKRYSFLVESESKNVTVKQKLNELIAKGVKPSVNDIEKAFSVEKVSKEFFAKYVKLYEKLNNAFKEDKVFLKIESKNNNGDEHFRENFVKKLMGQIVFLYFLQKKGWLGVEKGANWGTGKKDFLQSLLNECLEGGDQKKELGGTNFFNDYLEHLFYNNLNLKRDDDYSSYFGYKIPYLNGGLFEPINNYDWQSITSVLLAGKENNLLFKEIFDTFDEYNFTVYENDPLEQDVAVDPEMLGKVFENLLPENERKGKGAFYTPREIVHYMCKESLKNHIVNKVAISEDLVEKLFTFKESYLSATKRGNKVLDDEKYRIFEIFYEYGEKIIETLKNVKIVDPAVGSGAFPMGLLKEIVSIRKFIQDNVLLQDNVSEYQLKKETLENCIYGVDLDPGAVEIAKLRFWLSLVIEEEATDTIEPLPNLDYKIMQGNSLIEDIVVGDSIIKIDIDNGSKKITKKEEKSIGVINQTGLGLFKDEQEIKDILKKLKYLHKVFFQEKDGERKKEFKAQIDFVEKELIRISGEAEVNKLQSKIDEIEGKYIINGGFRTDKDNNEVIRLIAQISSIKEMEKKYEKDNIRSFFPWKLHFGEVFNENGGFDIVIGNPPYVRHEEIKEFKPVFEKYYETYTGTADLYCYFYELIGKLLKENGHGSYITSNKWIKAKYGENIRNYFKTKTKINEIIDFGGFKVFETATVDSNIIGFNKGYKEENNFIVVNVSDNFILYEGIEKYKKEKGFKFEQNKLQSNLWSLVDGDIFDFKDKIEKQGTKLKDWNIKINYGVKTGYNEAFIIDEKTKNDLIEKDPKNSEIIKPTLRGRDIRKNYINFPNQYLICTFPAKKISIDNYEILKNYLLNFGEKLEQNGKKGCRKKTSNKWFETQDQISYFQNFEKEKIIYGQFRQGEFSYDDKGYYLGSNEYMIVSNDLNLKYLISILNSKLAYFYQNLSSNTLSGNTTISQKSAFLELPIKQVNDNLEKPFINLVDQILEITKKEDYLEREDLQKQVKILENKIDKMVYELYELTDEEIELVEESLRK